MIKAAIFDMDGLLIDSEPLWVEAAMEVLNRAGVPAREDITRQTMGMRVNESIAYWLLRYPGACNWTPEEVEVHLTDRVTELIREKGEPMEGAAETVQLLAGEGMPLALASSSHLKIIDAVLEKVPVRPYLKAICSAGSELYGKPHPAVYLTTAGKLGMHPEFCLAFEDSINGMISARAAKMKCVAVPNSMVKDDRRFCLADITLDSLKDFRLEMLEAL